ncbi:hypothetical protein ACI2LM_15750 [Paenibacillus lautus]|uniref:hypothetical protein n=1 Tax=Paenibacillus lautus TaxID=1401 RepID=UPI00384D886E
MNKRRKWITIAVVLVLIIAIPIGWKLYENKKEADRQALIHMGDGLRAAMKEYDETAARVEKNKKLAEEYTEIMESILKGRVNADEVKDKVCGMEKELMELYPTIYTEPSSVCKE